MKFELIGVEVGVLLTQEDEEFEYYANNSPDLPYGFYDEDQSVIKKDFLDIERKSVLEYVEKGVEGTYGILCDQGFLDDDLLENVKELEKEYEGCFSENALINGVGPVNLFELHDMDYGYFKNKDEILYSVAKINGVLVEGFLEAELDKLAQKGLSNVLVDAQERSETTNTGKEPDAEYEK